MSHGTCCYCPECKEQWDDCNCGKEICHFCGDYFFSDDTHDCAPEGESMVSYGCLLGVPFINQDATDPPEDKEQDDGHSN